MRKKHPIRRTILIILLAALVVGLTALPMLTKGEGQERKASILRTTVERRTLQRYLSYGAPLQPQEPSQVTVPSGVKVTEYLVTGGDSVQAGDPIARVDDVSVMTAVRQAQEALDAVASQLKQTRSKITPGVITVNAEGALCSDGKPIGESELSDYLQFVTLSQQHREYEQILLELFHLHMDGVVTAPCDGLVGDVDKTQLQKLASGGDAQLVLLARNAPNGEDNNTPHYCLVGRIESVEGELWTMYLGAGGLVTDFLDLSGLNTSVSTVAEPFDASGFTIFRYSGGAWTVSGAQAGDAVLVDIQTGWILVIGSSSQPPEETEPEQTEPEETTPGEENPDPSEPEEKPEEGTKPSRPSGGGSIDISQFLGGNRGGSSGKEETTLYSTDKTQLATVTPMQTMTLTLNVDEMDISELTVGMEAQLTVEALPNQVFEANIVEISQFGTNAGGSSKFAVTLELPAGVGMLPGMNARVKLLLDTLPECPVIPVAALVEEGNRTLVYTGCDEKTQKLLQPVVVELGYSDGEYAQILSGLAEGQTVFYSYYDELEISNAVEKKGLFG